MNITFRTLTENENDLLSDFRVKCFEKKQYLLSRTSDPSVSGLDELDADSLNYCGIYTCEKTCKLCSSRQKLVCACRITYMENIPCDVLEMNLVDKPYVLLSRVCVDYDHRNKDLYLLMFLSLSKWLLDNTDYTEYIAYCTEEQYRLYKKLGATKLSFQPCYVYDNQPQPYHIITGNILQFNNYSKSYYETLQRQSVEQRIT